jgi:hypothetical protein
MTALYRLPNSHFPQVRQAAARIPAAVGESSDPTQCNPTCWIGAPNLSRIGPINRLRHHFTPLSARIASKAAFAIKAISTPRLGSIRPFRFFDCQNRTLCITKSLICNFGNGKPATLSDDYHPLISPCPAVR